MPLDNFRVSQGIVVGNITIDGISGNISGVNSLAAGSIAGLQSNVITNGNSTVNIPTTGSNVVITVAGSTSGTFSSSRLTINNLSASEVLASAITASSVNAGTIGNSGATLTGTLSTASQTNITAVGSLGNTQIASLGVGTSAFGTTGEIRATNNITAFYSSDKKFKENINDIPDALAKVVAIGGKTFDWTDEYLAKHGGEDNYFLRKQDFGVIAQDVLKQFPLAVRTRPDGSLAVDYEKLCALAFAAIVELHKEIVELKKSNA